MTKPNDKKRSPSPPSSLRALSAYYGGSAVVLDDALNDDTLGVRGAGYGSPITLHYYFDPGRFYQGSEIGKTGDVTVLYVINTNTPRYGTDSDESIVRSLLDRGFYVVVADYAKDPILSPDLDFSIQAIRSKLIDGRIQAPQHGIDAQADVALNYVLPAGYNLVYGIPYFAYDLHGAPGCLEEIVNVWNNDCRSVKRDFIVCWVDEQGRHKPTAPFDITDPYHYGQGGSFADGTCGKDYGVWFSAADGSDGGITNAALASLLQTDPERAARYRYTYMGNTHARDLYDCVKPDGSFIDLVLRMDVIYPTGVKSAPAMIAFSSSYTRVAAWTSDRRPQLTGFLFSGYTGVISDYGCVPMCRSDHYWYLSGTDQKYSVSGNNYTYSLGFYDSIASDTALLRILRALGDGGIDYTGITDKRELPLDHAYTLKESKTLSLPIKADAVGGYGNSKSGTVIRLGARHPERLYDIRRPEGQIGFSRYDLLCDPTLAAEKKDADGRIVSRYRDPYVQDGVTDENGDKLVRDPAEQPFKRGDRYAYSSALDLVYAQCGAGAETITSGHAPVFATGTQQGMGGGGSYYYFYSELVNRARAADIPFYGLVCPRLGHTYGYGEDLDYGVDTYAAFHKYANYYLQNGSPSCEIIDVDSSDDLPIASKHPIDRLFEIGRDHAIGFGFIGCIPGGENIEKIRILNAKTGKALSGCWRSAFGGQQWSFSPFDIEEGATYRITVPTDITDQNGRRLAGEKTLLFSTSAAGSLRPTSPEREALITDRSPALFAFSETDIKAASRVRLRFSVTAPAANTLLVEAAPLAASGKDTPSDAFRTVGTVTVTHAGIYTLDVTDFLRSTGCHAAVFRIRSRDAAGEYAISAFRMQDLSLPLSSLSSHYDETGIRLGYTMVADLASPDGTEQKMLRIYGQSRVSSWIDRSNRLCNNYTLIGGIPLLAWKHILADRPLTEADIGRHFTVSLTLYDTDSRLFYLALPTGTADTRDYHAPLHAFRTVKGYNHVSFAFSLPDTAALAALNRDQLLLFAENKTPITLPENVVAHADSYCLAETKKTGAQIGKTGLAPGYIAFDTAEAAYEAGVVSINEAHAYPLYIGDITCTERRTDVSLCRVMLSYDAG